MATIFRVGGLRIMIYTHDHPPPHVHVVGPDREARLALGNGTQDAQVLNNDGLSRRELLAALFKVNEHRGMLLRYWSEIHGNS
jgi:hypothetical protein